MTTRRIVLAMTASAFMAPSAQAAEGKWTRYVNDRFGTFITYPAALFTPQPPPENDDGRTFLSDDGARLLVFGRYNALDETLNEIEAALGGPDYADITFRAHGRHWFVVSGYRSADGQAQIYYEKYSLAFDAQVVHAMVLSYPVAARKRYDAIVAKLAKSFGPLL
jgi:hypothetical protein